MFFVAVLAALYLILHRTEGFEGGVLGFGKAPCTSDVHALVGAGWAESTQTFSGIGIP